MCELTLINVKDYKLSDAEQVFYGKYHMTSLGYLWFVSYLCSEAGTKVCLGQ